jgi:putative ABC transport system ATP-binding protein
LTPPRRLLGVCDAVKVHGRGENVVRALDGVTVEFGTGRFTAIMGPSGSGKSTLMHSVAGLDTLTSGTVLIGDTDISQLDDRKLTQLRRDRIGFIFQAFNPRLLAGVGPLRRVPCSGGRSGHGWGRQGLQGDIELLGIHR